MAATGVARPDQAFTILLCALGGEGGGVLADWLVDVARACDHAVQGTSIPGVAQRTGATTYYIEIFPLPSRELAGRRPVFGLYAVPGGVDLLVGTELLEVARQAGAGMVSPDRTAVIASSRRTLTTAEKMPLADGRVENEQLAAVLRDTARELELFDMAAMAESTGTVVSAVMLGAVGAWLAGYGALPFPRAAYETAIRAGGKGTEASLRGFAAAWDRIADAQARRAAVLEIAAQVAAGLGPRPTTVSAAVKQRFPADMHEIIALGLERVVDYQDAAYGVLYLDRLQRVLDAERAAAPGAAHRNQRRARRRAGRAVDGVRRHRAWPSSRARQPVRARAYRGEGRRR
jgi:indolepyruvate ferredoxin oxidoreductase beta subunit